MYFLKGNSHILSIIRISMKGCTEEKTSAKKKTENKNYWLEDFQCKGLLQGKPFCYIHLISCHPQLQYEASPHNFMHVQSNQTLLWFPYTWLGVTNVLGKKMELKKGIPVLALRMPNITESGRMSIKCLNTEILPAYLNRIYVLQWRSQSIPYPTVDLHSKELGFISNSLFPRFKKFWQYFDDWLQWDYLWTKFTES